MPVQYQVPFTPQVPVVDQILSALNMGFQHRMQQQQSETQQDQFQQQIDLHNRIFASEDAERQARAAGERERADLLHEQVLAARKESLRRENAQRYMMQGWPQLSQQEHDTMLEQHRPAPSALPSVSATLPGVNAATSGAAAFSASQAPIAPINAQAAPAYPLPKEYNSFREEAADSFSTLQPRNANEVGILSGAYKQSLTSNDPTPFRVAVSQIQTAREAAAKAATSAPNVQTDKNGLVVGITDPSSGRFYNRGDAEMPPRLQQEMATYDKLHRQNFAEQATLKQIELGGGAGRSGPTSLDSVPAQYRSNVQAIGEGRMSLSASQLRTKDGQRLANYVTSVYGDYDQSRALSYQATRKDFTSGPTSKGINSFNTVLAHLSRMYDNTSALGTLPVVSGIARGIGNEEAAALNSDRQAVATELAKAYAGGQIAEAEIKEWNNRLDVWSPRELHNNIKEIAQLLQGKLEAYRNQWQSGMPTGAVAPVSIMSPAGKAAYDHIIGSPVSNGPGKNPFKD